MRLLLFIAAFGAAAPAWAADTPSARAAYIERRGLIEADTQCRLFDADVRAALQAGAMQARGALLREGWSSGQLRELDQAVVSAARARPCTDPRTVASAASARAAFTTWVSAGTMQFPGWDRTWLASRSPGTNGWALSQVIDAPAAKFGIRTHNGAQQLALTLPLARRQAAPASARLIIRNTARANAQEISLPQRMAYGLAAGAPPANSATAFASIRSLERLERGGVQTVFVFPDSAFGELLLLDPRESIEIRIVTGAAEQRLFVEIGDIAAARAFLIMRGS